MSVARRLDSPDHDDNFHRVDVMLPGTETLLRRTRRLMGEVEGIPREWGGEGEESGVEVMIKSTARHDKTQKPRIAVQKRMIDAAHSHMVC